MGQEQGCTNHDDFQFLDFCCSLFTVKGLYVGWMDRKCTFQNQEIDRECTFNIQILNSLSFQHKVFCA